MNTTVPADVLYTANSEDLAGDFEELMATKNGQDGGGIYQILGVLLLVVTNLQAGEAARAPRGPINGQRAVAEWNNFRAAFPAAASGLGSSGQVPSFGELTAPTARLVGQSAPAPVEPSGRSPTFVEQSGLAPADPSGLGGFVEQSGLAPTVNPSASWLSPTAAAGAAAAAAAAAALASRKKPEPENVLRRGRRLGHRRGEPENVLRRGRRLGHRRGGGNETPIGLTNPPHGISPADWAFMIGEALPVVVRAQELGEIKRTPSGDLDVSPVVFQEMKAAIRDGKKDWDEAEKALESAAVQTGGRAKLRTRRSSRRRQNATRRLRARMSRR
uniref:Uncharacterized protein n=1 Tax=viral metagenome TaxID=1070528 RepID=A0A6C0DS32_9ZZZZ